MSSTSVTTRTRGAWASAVVAAAAPGTTGAAVAFAAGWAGPVGRAGNWDDVAVGAAGLLLAAGAVVLVAAAVAP